MSEGPKPVIALGTDAPPQNDAQALALHTVNVTMARKPGTGVLVIVYDPRHEPEPGMSSNMSKEAVTSLLRFYLAQMSIATDLTRQGS